MTRVPAILALADGSVFSGISIGALGARSGEVVFNTAMTGYQEILTDPSYAQQIITLTYPHIGNTGCNAADEESRGIFATGLVIRDLPLVASNWRSQSNLADYLIARDVVAIAEIDTRQLTRILRETGAQTGAIMAGPDANADAAIALARSFPGLKGLDLAKVVSVTERYDWNEGVFDLDSAVFKLGCALFKVVAYDFGIKRNILRLLVDRGCEVTVVPAQTSAEDALAFNPDGIFLSNGPGDPEPCDYAVAAIKVFIEKQIPIFGICLGHQLLGLAAGARTMKMKFGHHGANHPVIDLQTGRVMISSQNHGFCIDETTLPAGVRVTHRSLFDGSNQGIALEHAPAFSFQGHPEASPGPHDVVGLFDRFVLLMKANPGLGSRDSGLGDQGPGLKVAGVETQMS